MDGFDATLYINPKNLKDNNRLQGPAASTRWYKLVIKYQSETSIVLGPYWLLPLGNEYASI